MRIRKKAAWKLAEDRVSGKLLELLLDGYVILNDIKYRYGNIDHVAIRPDGVLFLIETKSHRVRQGQVRQGQTAKVEISFSPAVFSLTNPLSKIVVTLKQIFLPLSQTFRSRS